MSSATCTLTVFGPPASGKSWLAQQVARAGIDIRAARDCFAMADRHAFEVDAPKQRLWEVLHEIGVAYAPVANGALVQMRERHPSDFDR